MESLTRGIVLNQWKYNDESVVVSIYTRSHGAVSTLVRTGFKRRPSGLFLLLRPLTVIEFQMDFQPSRQMQRIHSPHLGIPFVSIPYSPVKEMVALFLADFLYHALRAESENEELYSFIEQSLLWLDRTERPVANFHLSFLVNMAHEMGIAPFAESFLTDMYFDLQEAEFSSLRPAHSFYIPPLEASFLPKLLRMNYRNMHLFRFTRLARQYTLDALVTYFRLHLPDFPTLKSLDVLRDLMD